MVWAQTNEAKDVVQLTKIFRFYRMVEQFLDTHVNTIFCFK